MRDIELAVAKWLRFERRCLLVMFERAEGGVYRFSRPDVIAVTKERQYIEVEVKRTLSDFRANAKKHHVMHREAHLPNWPRLFYFAIPESLYAAVEPECPDYAGLLVLSGYELKVAKRAKINTQARELKIKTLASLVAMQTNCLIAEVQRLEGALKALRYSEDLYQVVDYAI